MLKLSMPPLPIETSNVLFDISRLLRNGHRTFATGVERIDLAIALDLHARFGNRASYIYAGWLGNFVLPQRLSVLLLRHLESNWIGSKADRLPFRLRCARLFGEVWPYRKNKVVNSDTTYVVASHSGMGKIRGAMNRLDPRGLMHRVIYLHDIIPLDMPEYQRDVSRDLFKKYLRELTDRPLIIATNSYYTDSRIRELAEKERWPVKAYAILIPEITAVEDITRSPSDHVSEYLSDSRPFFTIIGTIEPRKNHLLLLNIWRQFVLEGIVPPRLCIIGKRGWENENILDMLERCEAIKGHVTEFQTLGDQDVQLLMKKSVALLFPSFVEGLGIPLLEAKALGVPSIVSDIPVFHEIAPDDDTLFLNPLDGVGWKDAIVSFVAKIN